MCGDPLAAVGDAVGEAFARSCQQIVQNQEELDKLVKQGWYDTPDLAMAGYEVAQRSMADIAAMRHFTDQRMGEVAQAEAKLADDATHEHLPALPEKRKAGRPRKVQ